MRLENRTEQEQSIRENSHGSLTAVSCSRSVFIQRSEHSNDFRGINGAGSRIRTRDPEITNHVLYQLSYTGAGKGFYQIGR